MKNSLIKNIILSISGLGLLCGLFLTAVYVIHIPASLEKVIKYDLNDKFELVETIHFQDKKNGPIIEKQYDGKELGFISISMYAYKGLDLMTLNNHIYKDYKTDYAEKMQINNNNVAYIQYLESDNMPDMLMRAFIEYKNYIFDLHLSNYDEQITDIQKQEFKKFIKSINFIGE